MVCADGLWGVLTAEGRRKTQKGDGDAKAEMANGLCGGIATRSTKGHKEGKRRKSLTCWAKLFLE